MRTDLSSGPLGQKISSRDELAEKSPDSARQIQRYIRLTNLIPELLEMVDNDELPLRPAVELSYLYPDEQSRLLDMMQDIHFVPSLEQAKKLKEYSQRTELTVYLMQDLLSAQKAPSVKITLKPKRLHQYFPASYTQQQMEEIIFSLLEKWKSDQKGVESDGEDGQAQYDT